MRADAYELLHGRPPAENGVISDRHMPGEHHVVREQHTLAEPAIMRDMRLCEQRAALPDIRRHPSARCARVDRHAFANDAIGGDLERRGLARIFLILRRLPDRREGKHARARPYCRAPDDNHMRDELDAGVQDNVASDLAIRAYLHIRIERGAALHQGERMHECRGCLLLHIARGAVQGAAFPAASEAPISASQTSAPSTFALPSNHHMLRF